MKNQTGRYFKYAVGEILLVVIGILIALQLNNLNEKKKVTNEMKEKINALVVNLEDEIGVSGIQFHPQQINRFQRFLDGELSIDSLRANPDFLDLSGLRIKDDVLEENINILIENEDRLPMEYKPLISKMKSLKFYFSNYKQGVQEFKEIKRNNERFIENNYAWYSYSDSVSVEKKLKYYMTDSLFRNRLYTFLEMYRSTYSFYSTTIIQRLGILCAIKQAEENYKGDDYRSYISTSILTGNTSGVIFKEGKKVPCETTSKGTLNVVSTHLILNTSTDTVSFYNRRGLKFNIPPQSSIPYFNSKDNGLIKLFRNETCEAYQVTTNNYIIIE